MITQSSSADGPSPRPGLTHHVAYLDTVEAMVVWKKAIEDGTLHDLSQFFTGLSDDEATVLRICGSYDRKFRRCDALKLRGIVQVMLACLPGWTKERAYVAISNLQANGILVHSETVLRLTRNITGEGCNVPRPKKPKMPKIQAGNSDRHTWLVQEFGGRCAYCRRLVPKDEVTCDHVVPKSHGGVDTQHNWALCCGACNIVKRDRTPEQWARDILRWRPGKTKTPKSTPLSYLQSCLTVAPAFAMSWLLAVFSLVKGGVR